MWIFGYGSLIWRPNFAFVEKRAGYIENWARRFYQGSIDHRGVPEAPGRVVTLLPEDGARCWGMAFRVDMAREDAILAQLDYREKGGYARHAVDVFAAEDGEQAAIIARGALVYVATEGNPNYLGEAPVDAIARQILGAHGPSGANVDYLLNLAKSLRRMEARDAHVFAVEDALKRLLDESDA